MKRFLVALLALSAGCIHQPRLPRRNLEHALDSTVLVTEGGICAGVAVDHGLILTAKHCVDEDPIVATRNGERCTTEGVIQADDRDLALIRVRDCALRPMPVAAGVHTGEIITTIGHPSGHLWQVSRGVVSSVEDDYIFTDALVYFGNSGGPAINTRGELVGIASMLLRSGHGVFENVSGRG